ncbi:signal transduction histidine kinase [Catenulispora acidiphila DSM 44928]|uniref:histidine kinase n=1 Tax=Catenulispora acidiphila (strain DSM 44928 / JCM 14897 / NBRC 102108 / NRRL B-24433 / ID139908) TaxID=479433 RepID=C7QCS3_CATAD|nr:PAS domain-containing sensor histidine kinase [Catenulispora acidiphila]ACU76536.1 signal transduction histidine kinase [Catenulispora acidiphila DSM 44928]
MNDLIHTRTDLDEADLDWLHLLIGDWQLLADLSFADLVLWAPLRTEDGADPGQAPLTEPGYVAVAQMRPNTGPTCYTADLVGSTIRRGQRPMLDLAIDSGRIRREGDPEWREDVPVRVEAIPVRRGDRVIAVISRNTNLLAARTPSRLELTYLQTAADLARMIAEGIFPYPESREQQDNSPRVGDGVIRLDADGAVVYASPNALSAYHRLGYAADMVGEHLGALTATLAPVQGAMEEALEVVASGRKPREAEVEGNGTVVQLRAIPLRPQGERTGALVLVHDVTELRRRERELISKDATIREIHHRVKNNLQTVAALLRLQARRIEDGTGRAALEEAVRRVGSIALVHETLSQTLDERVDFDEIADRVLAMVVDVGAGGPGGPGGVTVRAQRTGRFGVLPAQIATPLSMVLTEVLQNSLEHGLADQGGSLQVEAHRHGPRLCVVVTDDGNGLPPGFDAATAGNLGLQIVRTLVHGDLKGTFDLRPAPGGRGAVAVLDVEVGEVPAEPGT